MKRIVLILPLLILFVFLPSCQTKEKADKTAETHQGIEHFVEHYPNGIKKVEGDKLNGKRNGRWVFYYEDGMMWSEGTYRHGKREGSSIVYYENGKKKIEGQYKKDMRIGEWKVWEDDGSLVKKIDLNSMLTAKDSLHLDIQ